MIPERSLEVLRAIVQEYIENREPVGSKVLVEKHGFGVSAATIRNDMALLEEEQLIAQPHTSAGRVPTDKGYRLFVDRLHAVKPLSAPEATAIESFLSDGVDLDETLNQTVRLLAQLTQQLAVVQYPTLGKASVQSIELIPVTESRALLVLVADSGRVQQHMLDFHTNYDTQFLSEMRAKLIASLSGVPLAQVKAKLEEVFKPALPEQQLVMSELTNTLIDLVDANRQEKILIAGAANLARSERDFAGGFSSLLDAIEEKVVLLRLINELQHEPVGVAVRIGAELQADQFQNASMVVSAYQAQGAELAKVGVIGPTRMNYSSNIAAVNAVASYLTKLLGR